MESLTPEYFLQRPRNSRHYNRLDIALALAERPRTRRELADAIGREFGSWGEVFQRMHYDEVVEEVPGDSGESTSYRLAEGAVEHLEQVVAGEDLVGRLGGGITLLEVSGPDPRTVRLALSGRGLGAVIAWAVALGEDGRRWLLALAHRAPAGTAERLLAALPAAGLEARLLSVGEVLNGDEFRRRGRAVLEAHADLERAMAERQRRG